MKFVLLFLLLASMPAMAALKIRSATVGIVTVNSDSELKDRDDNKVLTFSPNVSSGIGMGVELEHISLGYVFDGGQAQFKDYQKSSFHDLRFNFHLNHFDFRLSDQKYQGALVEEGGVRKYYSDYKVRSINGRAHFYKNKDYLEYIRDGHHLLDQLVLNEGFHRHGSWFIGMNFDKRSLKLPANLDSTHLAAVNRADINYHSNFDAFSWGPLAGFDGILQYGHGFARGKLAMGPAFQSSGGTVPQVELAIKFGTAFLKRHLITVGIDVFVMSFKDKTQTISNNNSQVGLNYTYGF